MHILTIVGARPQFVKAAVVSRALRDTARKGTLRQQLQETILHTGQHFDENMSGVFFEELDIPRPDVHLNVSGGSHGAMTGEMLREVEKVILARKPDCILVYGDTNSTLAGALAAAKLHVPVAHVEAGLRSFNKAMPEEINRILTDHVSELLFCPTANAVQNLAHEGLIRGVHDVGDVMYDATLYYEEAARKSRILDRVGVPPGRYVVATCHRQENTDSEANLRGILEGLSAIAAEMPVILPLHPRTRRSIEQLGLSRQAAGIRVVEPVGYLDMVALQSNAALIATDSGGVQREAFFLKVPCITMRNETEWVETLEGGENILVGADAQRIVEGFRTMCGRRFPFAAKFGSGDAAERILLVMAETFGRN